MPSTSKMQPSSRRGTRCKEAKKLHCGGFRVAIQWKLTKIPPPPGRRVAAPENPLRRRISLCHSVEFDQDAAAAWKEGNKGYQSARLNPLRRRSSLRFSERLRKNRSIRGFRSSPNKLNGKPDTKPFRFALGWELGFSQ